MKKTFALILAGCMAAAAFSQDKKYEVYQVCFYNIENLFDTINNNGKYDLEFSPQGSRQWNGDKYWKKIHNIAYAISNMTLDSAPNVGPAVIGIAEVENITVLQDLVKDNQIKQWRMQIVHHDSPDRRGIDVALLYNPRLFRVLNVVSVPYPTPDDNPGFRTRDQLCVTGLLAGEKVSVIVNHWPSRLGGQEQSSPLRELAAARVMQTVDSLLADDPDQGIIVMGDLNDDPQDPSCAKVMNGKKNAEDVTADNGFYNPWWATLDGGVGTLAYRGSWNLFDQIMVSKHFLGDRSSLTFLRNDVLNWDFLKNTEGSYVGYPLRTYASGVFLNGYSDHFPTRIVLIREAAQEQ